MNSSILLSVTTFVYGLAAFAYLALIVFKRPVMGRVATWTIAIGALGNFSGFIWRWMESYQMGVGHAPLSNLYESLVFFSLTTALLYLYMEYRYRNQIIGVFAAPLSFFAMTYASLAPSVNDRIQPLIPALKSNWLIAHVISCFIGYAAFAVAFGVGVMYLYKRLDTGTEASFASRFPPLETLDELIVQLVKFGFMFLTVGIITGAVWANSAWGRYWGWDPKETWSLITWLVYATMLHFRVFLSWRGKIFAIFAIIGFLAVLFTYFGVNYLPGLHSYGTL